MLSNLVACAVFLFLVPARCCNLEEFFSEKQVSVEESASAARVVFRGFTIATAPTSSNDVRGVFTAYFELINTYKGAEALDVWVTSSYRYAKSLLVFC